MNAPRLHLAFQFKSEHRWNALQRMAPRITLCGIKVDPQLTGVLTDCQPCLNMKKLLHGKHTPYINHRREYALQNQDQHTRR